MFQIPNAHAVAYKQLLVDMVEATMPGVLVTGVPLGLIGW